MDVWFPLRPSPFFLRLPSNAFPDIGSVGRIEKKKNLKQNHKKSRNSRPWYPRTKENVQYTVKNVHVFVPVFLYAITMLIFQIKRRSDDGKRRKKKRIAKYDFNRIELTIIPQARMGSESVAGY